MNSEPSGGQSTSRTLAKPCSVSGAPEGRGRPYLMVEMSNFSSVRLLADSQARFILRVQSRTTELI